MNDRLTTAEEQDDAAFRARLAPLASEVLPPPPVVIREAGRPSNRRRNYVALAVVLLAGSAGLLSRWPGFDDPRAAGGPRIVSRNDPPSVVVAPKPAVPSDARTEPAPSSSEEMVGLLLRRGDDALAVGDIVAARLLFERAAGMGSATAAREAGKTYDVEFLLRAGARGIRADPIAAAAWFRKAAALGDPEARARLARLDQARP